MTASPVPRKQPEERLEEGRILQAVRAKLSCSFSSGSPQTQFARCITFFCRNLWGLRQCRSRLQSSGVLFYFIFIFFSPLEISLIRAGRNLMPSSGPHKDGVGCGFGP
ncbi:hypothetical protein BJX61DRAFT_528220 [Aspergillus egyptiacus]|nr:hypothetical protein BJX61DRAFT_528220 [Aspergillus egyptiacus]